MDTVLKIGKKIVNVLSDISFILVFGYLIILVPKIFGYNPLAIVEVKNNEVPFKDGALIFYKKVKVEEIHKKDVILYKDTLNDYYTYVVKNIDDGKIYINDDTKYSIDELSGKVAPAYIPYYGYYISFIDNHIILLYILCGIVIIDFIAGGVIGSFKSTFGKSTLSSTVKNDDDII